MPFHSWRLGQPDQPLDFAAQCGGFQACYAEYCRSRAITAKSGHAFDGHILEIYEDLIEIGVNASTADICMDIATRPRFAGRITFWGEIDRQRLLPFGTPDEVRAAVAQVIKHSIARRRVIAQLELGAAAKSKTPMPPTPPGAV